MDKRWDIQVKKHNKKRDLETTELEARRNITVMRVGGHDERPLRQGNHEAEIQGTEQELEIKRRRKYRH